MARRDTFADRLGRGISTFAQLWAMGREAEQQRQEREDRIRAATEAQEMNMALQGFAPGMAAPQVAMEVVRREEAARTRDALEQQAEIERERQEADDDLRRSYAAKIASGYAGRQEVIASMNAGDPIAREVYESVVPETPMDPSVPGATLAQATPPLPPRPKTAVEERLEELDPSIIEAEAERARAIAGAEAEAKAEVAGEAPVEPPKPTQAEQAAAGFLVRIESAMEGLSELMDDEGDRLFMGGRYQPSINPLDQYNQSFRVYADEIVRAILRLESGAQISAQEKEDMMAQLPERWNTRETIEQKWETLRNMLEAVRIRAGILGGQEIGAPMKPLSEWTDEELRRAYGGG